MNGLEAIELMKQGKMVVDVCVTPSVYRINNGTVEFKSYESEEWLLIHYFDLKGQYEEYIEPKSLTGWERVKEDEKYYWVADDYVEEEIEVGMDHVYDSCNYFSTEEKAEEIAFKQTLFRKLQRFSDENGGNEIDWKDHNQWKFYICYRYDCEVLVTYRTSCVKGFGIVYFISEEVTEKAIELFHDDLIKYFTHYWNAGGNE